MKDARTSLLLSVALALFLISVAIFYAWGYYKFTKENEVNNEKTLNTPKNKLLTPAENYRDSLQKIYTAIVANQNTNNGTQARLNGTFQLFPDSNSSRFHQLRNEIEAILKNHPIKADLDIAKQKIHELQGKLAQLNARNVSVEEENKRLNGQLNQLTKELKGIEQNTVKTESSPSPDKAVPQKVNSPSGFSVSRLHLSGILATNGVERESNEAGQIEKLVGSFTVKNNFNQPDNAEIVVVVTQPDGRVLQSSAWESGSFDTPEGRKIYSSRFHVDYASGEAKPLLFSLSSDTYQKGEYAMQIYCNKKMIGKATKILF